MTANQRAARIIVRRLQAGQYMSDLRRGETRAQSFARWRANIIAAGYTSVIAVMAAAILASAGGW